MISLKSGTSCLLWHDLWEDKIWSQTSPELLFLQKLEHLLVLATSASMLQDLFHLPLSTEAYEQFVERSLVLRGLSLQLVNDEWAYIWGFSSFLI